MLQSMGSQESNTTERLSTQHTLSWERLKVEEKGMTEDEMVEWHHQLDGHEFGWTPGAGDGQERPGGAVVHRVTKSRTRLE